MSSNGLHSGRIAVLTYHSLDDSGSVLSTSPQVFAEQMRVLHELHVRVVSLSEVGQALGRGSVQENLVVLTFDDGFSSVYEHAFPILQRYGDPATIFLVTAYCGKTNSWPGQPLTVERRPLLGWAEIKEMSRAGISFGSHTVTHPDLRKLPRHAVEEELVASKKTIEDATGDAVETIAYPYGACDETIKRLAQAHFSLGCATTLGFAGPKWDPFSIERLDMYYLSRPGFFRRLFSPEMAAYIRLREALRRTRGWMQGAL
jgi:peptidoglycan/xylan/chitin deacetylase (PgdA/CDA1 family)